MPALRRMSAGARRCAVVIGHQGYQRRGRSGGYAANSGCILFLMSWKRRKFFFTAFRGLVATSGIRAVYAQQRGELKALVFDTFGTLVDWRGSIIAEGAVWGKSKGLTVDWARFADRWRAGYAPAVNKVRNGEMPWTKLD